MNAPKALTRNIRANINHVDISVKSNNNENTALEMVDFTGTPLQDGVFTVKSN